MKLREDRKVASWTNKTWAMGFVRDQPTAGIKQPGLIVSDSCTDFTSNAIFTWATDGARRRVTQHRVWQANAERLR